jgi:hydrogenase maturation protease
MAAQAVVALGNPFRGDDGVGPAVVEALEDRDLADLDLLDLGDATFELLYVLADHDAAVIVDAVDFGGDPGDVAVFAPESAEDVTGGQRGAHDTNPFELLSVADQLEATPATVRIVGIQPATVEFGDELSVPISDALPEIVDEVLAVLEGLTDSAGSDGSDGAVTEGDPFGP